MALIISQSGLVDLAGGDRSLDFADCLGHLNVARAGFCAIEDRMATEDAKLVIEDRQALSASLIAAIEDETMSVDDSRRAHIFVVCPKGWA